MWPKVRNKNVNFVLCKCVCVCLCVSVFVPAPHSARLRLLQQYLWHSRVPLFPHESFATVRINSLFLAFYFAAIVVVAVVAFGTSHFKAAFVASCVSCSTFFFFMSCCHHRLPSNGLYWHFVGGF